MNRHPSIQLRDTLNQLNTAVAELEALTSQLNSFEALVDAQLGSLLDQLSDLNAETAGLDAQLRHIREERLYGKDQMSYIEGAPLPGRPIILGDLPPLGLSHRGVIHAKVEDIQAAELKAPDIKLLYRKLARRYHPDLARSEADRSVSNEQMSEINRAYNAGDMKTLMRLAGIVLPYGIQPPQSATEGHHRKRTETELEEVERRLKSVQQQINRMSNLPIVKLSLEVKLTKRQARNLLREMAAELQYKVGRKLAERDYLQAQIKTSLE